MYQLNSVSSEQTHDRLEGYYRIHSRIYDGTRWAFLFGRASLIETLCRETSPRRILEVGCGTGTNLLGMARRFPRAELFGLDLSPHMLEQAQRKASSVTDRLHFLQRTYDEPVLGSEPFDLVLFSYSLSMFNPGWERALENVRTDLGPGGLIAVVDFNETPSTLFGRWMELNHVRLGGHLLAGLQPRFRARTTKVRRAFLGLWTYFQFIGEKTES